MTPQLAICILSSEIPLDGSILGVACLLPCSHFGFQKFSITNAPIQTLPTENANLDLSHVQPTRVLWGVVELNTAQELLGSACSQHVVEALFEVGVQVIEHQVNSSCLGVPLQKMAARLVSISSSRT